MKVVTIVNTKTREVSNYNVEVAFSNRPDNTPGFEDFIILDIMKYKDYCQNDCFGVVNEVKDL